MDGSSEKSSSAENTTSELISKYSISPACTEAEFLSVCKLYAGEIVDIYGLNVDIYELSWSISKRAKRRAGAVSYRNGEPYAVKLTWDYFVHKGWEAMAETIRHELIHVHLLNKDGNPKHDSKFKQLADELDTHIHCDRFSEPKWWVRCSSCEIRLGRYQRSKLIDQTERYQCGDCGGDLYVEENIQTG